MIESYYLGIYWGGRRESDEECSQRMRQFLASLMECDSCFTRWFRKGKSREAALMHEISLEPAKIQRLFLDGMNHVLDSGMDGKLGFHIGLWNGGEDKDSVELSVSCGCYSLFSSVNSCVINLPYSGPVAERILDTPILVEVMKCAVLAWDPDWGVVASRFYENNVPFPPGNSPRMGWIVYLSQHRGTIPVLPSPVRIISVGSQGNILILTDERFTGGNSEHVRTASQVAKILNKAGLLAPL